MDESVISQEAALPPTDKPAIRRAGRPGTIGGRTVKHRQPAIEAAREPALERTSGERLTRRRRTDDPFFFDKRLVPDGYSYEWKRLTVHGATDPEHQVNLRENHWRPVPASRHPHLMPDGTKGDGPIIRKGMMLMERPDYLTKDARDEDYAIAREQVQMKEGSLLDTPEGSLTRAHPSVQANSRIRKTRGPLVIEEN